jgi:hypothetical protein
MTTDVTDPGARITNPPATRSRQLLGRRGVRLALGILLVIAVGIGAYVLSSSLSSSSVPAASVTPLRPPGGVVGPGPGRSGAPGPGAAGSRPIAVGAVASIGSNSFTLTSRAGTTVTVTVSTSTTYVGAAGFSAVKVGDRVAVIGTSTNSKEIAASRVLIGVGGRGFGGDGPLGGGGNPSFGGNGAAGGGSPSAL